MRRLQDAVGAGDRTRLDSLEPKCPVRIGGRAPVSVEGGVEQFFLIVLERVVAAFRIGLPDFDHRIDNWRAVAIDDAALDDDPIAARLRPYQIFGYCFDQ